MGLMEQSNGRIQEVERRSEKSSVDLGRTYSYRGAWYLCLIPLCCLSLVGCSLKLALITGAATTAAVGVTSVLAPGVVLVPAVIGGTTAVIASAMTAERSVKGERSV